MRIHRTVVGLGSFLLVVVAACGGGAPAVAPPVTPVAQPDPSAPSKTEKPADPPAVDPKSSAEHKRQFMTGCANKAANSPDYCECAWGEFKKIFTDEEMGQTGDLPKAKLEKVKESVEAACASKIPEELVKQGYDKACVGDQKDMQPYCDCTWAEFRKRFSAAELRDEETVKGDRFAATRGPVIKACASKMSENAAKSLFMKGCNKDPKLEKFCTCAWKEVRKIATPAEIAADQVAEAKMRGVVDKGCAKLRPK